MAQNAPPSQDVQDIQFKLHDKFNIFPESKEPKSLVSLLAVSSAKGLLFAGNPDGKELKVFKLKEVVDAKTTGQELKARVVNLSGEPKSLACSCDGSMLAVNYFHNNTGFLQIFQVDSFVSPRINSLYNLPVAPESNVFVLQLLWNPVIANNIALILSDGSVAMFTLNNGGQYDKVTLGKEHQVKSGCWSPKGKQIVFGFAEGKLQQFKPNLQPARAIPCPPGIHSGPFDCIALHWLSTYQFAVIYLQRGQDMCPSLFIVNAPKAGQPSYINYYDICYSAPGPRIQQLSFTHIAQWNLLLVTSANGVEVGVLGTRETGENPNWIQYTLLDEARIEMPLTDAKDETYPMGFAYDTSSAHQIVVGEKRLPVMPMIHVLSTQGHMVSYNFLNLTPNAVDVCSPPPPLTDMSGQFKPLSETMASSPPVGSNQIKVETNNNEQLATNKAQNAGEGFGDMTFTLGSNMVTSTPAIKDKPAPLFGSQVPAAKPIANVGFTANTVAATAPTATANKPAGGFGFSATPQHFGSITSGTSFGGFAGTSGFPGKPSEMGGSTQPATQTANANKNAETYKPLYAVPATYTPPPVQQPIKSDVKPVKPTVVANKINLNSGELDEVVKKMIVIQIEAFETELKQIRQQSKQLLENIGSPVEIKPFTKQLNDLQEIIEQANDHEFEQDVQSLRHAMNESYAMLAECRTKLDLYNNPNLSRLSTVSTSDPTSRRQLAKLQAYVAANKNQLSQLNQLIEAQWSQYQDVVRRNSKNQMHIPCLDGIYQRMSKLKDLLARQRTKMNCIKTKLKQKGLNYQPPSELDVTSKAVGVLTKNQSTMESLADSILSMSLSQVVSQTHAKLSDEKLKALRNFTKQHQQIAIIKPKRPDRVDLKSEVILETKLETERKQKEIVKKLQQHQQQQLQVQQQQQQQYIHQQQQQYIQQQQQQQQQFMVNKTPINLQQKSQPNANYSTSLQQQLLRPQATMVQAQQQQQQPVIAKPTASKPSMVTSQPPAFITPTSSTSATISFGGNSSFVKTSQSTPITKTEEVSKTTASSTSFTGGFGMPQQAAHNFAQPKPLQATTTVSSESKENLSLTTPISFSAKVIGGNDTKSFSNLGNKTNTTSNMVQPPISQGFAAATATSGFSAFATTKPAPAAKTTQDKNESKQPEEAPKSAATLTTVSTTSVTINPFVGFGSTTKSTVSSTAATSSSFSTSVFGSNSSSNNTPVSTPFSGQPFSSSAFSFTAATSTPSTVPSAVENNNNKAVTNTAQSTATGVKTTEVKTILTSSGTTAATPTSSAALNLVVSKAPAAPNVTITSTGMPTPKPAAAAPTSCNTPTPTGTSDPTDSLFGSLNICKPTPKIAGESNKSGNIFSGFATSTPAVTPGSFAFASASGAGDGTKSFFSSATTTASTLSTDFSFTAAAKTPASTADNVFGKPSSTATATTGTADSTTITTTTTTAATSVVSSAPSTASAPAPATATSSFPFPTTATSSASTAGSLFGALSLTASTTGTTTNATPTTTSPGGNIFGGGTSVFGQSSTAAATSTTTSLFGGGAAVGSSAPSLFGSTAPAVTTAATPGSGSIFAAAATPQSAGSIFGGIPKPEQSIFGGAGTAPQPAGTGLFAAAAANTNPPVASGGSIFGGGSSSGFGSSTAGGSIFGGSSTSTSPFAANTAANSSGSIFAAAAATTKPPESGGNLFGSPTQQPAGSGGSIFGKSTFGGMATTQPSGNIFGAPTTQSPTSGGFGASGGSIFGGSAMSNTGTSGGSIFGAAAAATAPAFASNTSATGGFGAFSQPTTATPFASPTGGGFAASSTAPFGSPQQQSAFAKPVFGGPATFGSPTPAFGAQPTFGGAPTFGSPKGFGSFAATSPASPSFGAPAQAAPAPKGNIFETLGSQDSGLSFGNLAHTAQAPQQKPTFGGVSFLNYRS